MTNKETLEAHGYKLVTRAAFDSAADVPDGLREYRKEQLALKGAWIVYDPSDDEEGWLLVGDDAEALARETVEYTCSEQ